MSVMEAFDSPIFPRQRASPHFRHDPATLRTHGSGSDALLCTGAGRLIRGFCLPRRDHQTPGGIGSPKRSPDYKVRTAEPAPQTQATIQIVGRRSTGQSAEILLVDVAGRSLVVEEDHQGGSAVLGDGAFTAPGM